MKNEDGKIKTTLATETGSELFSKLIFIVEKEKEIRFVGKKLINLASHRLWWHKNAWI